MTILRHFRAGASIVLLTALVVPLEARGGDGTLTPHPVAPQFGAVGLDASLGDVDGDVDLDAVIVAAQQEVWLNDGTGSLSPHPTAPFFGGGGFSRRVLVGDLDGDGDLDAVVQGGNLAPATTWLNDATGVFTPHPSVPAFGSGVSLGIALGDLDGDGDLDAVVANNGGPETVWLNDGSGGFAPHPGTPSFGGGNSGAVVLGDLNGDGSLDAIVVNNDTPNTLWLNNGPRQLRAAPGHTRIRKRRGPRRRGRTRRPRRRR